LKSAQKKVLSGFVCADNDERAIVAMMHAISRFIFIVISFYKVSKIMPHSQPAAKSFYIRYKAFEKEVLQFLSISLAIL
jgi:hypothetical protein